MTKRLAVAITAAFALAGAATEASALTNVSFEDGLAGWSGSATTVSSVYSNAGSFMATMSSSTGNNTLSQFGLPALGSGYTLFYSFNTTSDKNWFKVDYTTATGGTASWSTLVPQMNSSIAGGSYVIPTGTTGLQFTLHRGRDTPTASFDVSPVPEPGEWAMMLAGIGLIGFVVNRRRRQIG